MYLLVGVLSVGTPFADGFGGRAPRACLPLLATATGNEPIAGFSGGEGGAASAARPGDAIELAVDTPGSLGARSLHALGSEG